MGWLFSSRWSSKADLVNHLRSKERWGDGFEILRACTVGNNHWYLAKRLNDGLTFIGLDLMQGGGRDHGWGYKDMDESCGPYHFDCPISYLDLASPAGNDHAKEWREQVRQYRAAKAAVKPVPGLVIEFGGVSYRLEVSLGHKGWRVSRVSDGVPMRMPSKYLSRALTSLRRAFDPAGEPKAAAEPRLDTQQEMFA